MPASDPDNRRIDALLLQPPPGDLTGPYPALAYLKSYAEGRGWKVRIRDLGIEALYRQIAEENLHALLERADRLRGQLESARFLNPEQQHLYVRVLDATGVGLKPDLIDAAIRLFKDASSFYDYRAYSAARRTLDAFFRLLSAVHYPTTVTASEYPTVTFLKTMENVRAHGSSQYNPYMDYYENVLIPEIAANPPAVIGVSMVFAAQSVQALVLGRLLKERFPEAHVTMGGAYLSQWVMQMEQPQFEALFSCADTVICGEGEQPFSELLACVRNGRSLDGVPNLIQREASGRIMPGFGEMVYTDVADQPPPDFSDLDLGKYLAPEPVIPYALSRGCYWGKCAFCQNRYGDHRMRRYQTVPAAKAVAEMTRLSEKYGSRHFNFSNDVLDPAYLKTLSRALLDAGKAFVWNTDLRAEAAFTPEVCELMAAAGLNCTAIGFESGCQKVLDAMDKGNRVKTTAGVMKSLHGAGAAVQAMGIFGFPGETEADAERTVRFLEDHADAISYYVMGLLMVMPGSKMFDAPGAYGVSSVGFENNPLKTPEPVWRSDRRLSPDAVHRLYDRLSRLESVYAINEYPYVGALSTNHGFLYFRKFGPDALKKLRTQETGRAAAVHEKLRSAGGKKDAGARKKIKPRPVASFAVFQPGLPAAEALHAYDPLQRGRASQGGRPLCLMTPTHFPIPVSEVEARFLSRVDGRRNLKAVLSKFHPGVHDDLLQFLALLVEKDILTI